MTEQDLEMALTKELISFSARLNELTKSDGDKFSQMGAEFVGRFRDVAKSYHRERMESVKLGIGLTPSVEPITMESVMKVLDAEIKEHS